MFQKLEHKIDQEASVVRIREIFLVDRQRGGQLVRKEHQDSGHSVDNFKADQVENPNPRRSPGQPRDLDQRWFRAYEFVASMLQFSDEECGDKCKSSKESCQNSSLFLLQVWYFGTCVRGSPPVELKNLLFFKTELWINHLLIKEFQVRSQSYLVIVLLVHYYLVHIKKWLYHPKTSLPA